MSPRAKLAIAFIVAVILPLVLFMAFHTDNQAQKTAEATRRGLRNQGFKTDLSEFNFSLSPEMQARAAAITNVLLANSSAGSPASYLRGALLRANPDSLPFVNEDTATVLWKQKVLPDQRGKDLWPSLREILEENRQPLDNACAAALSGPIAIQLDATRGNNLLLPHLAAIKNLAQALAARSLLELHDGKRAAAWTNVLAVTRVVTAWNPEPVEISHMVRWSCLKIAFNAIWEALQAGGWTDEQLARLQTEWASVDLLKGIPEIAAFERASWVGTCQLERQEPAEPMTSRQVAQSAKAVLAEIESRRVQALYRQYGTYDDENDLMLFYRDRELQLRRAIQAPNWAEMRQLPGVTNTPTFKSRHSSTIQMRMNMKQMTIRFQGAGAPFLGQSAEAETRRRLILTAIALERFHLRRGSYPKALSELTAPPNALIDFMDGQPVRYRLSGDGHFVLYSVGLDCIDNGGKAPQRRNPPIGVAGPFGPQRDVDIVWPRPSL